MELLRIEAFLRETPGRGPNYDGLWPALVSASDQLSEAFRLRENLRKKGARSVFVDHNELLRADLAGRGIALSNEQT